MNFNFNVEPKIIQLRKIESQRKIELEQAVQQLTITKHDVYEQNQKLNAMKVRNRILQEEVAQLKHKVTISNDQIGQNEENTKLLNVINTNIFSCRLESV